MQTPELSVFSEDTDRDQHTGQSANDVLFLALYLILLAFFILLNAHASPSERKTQAVLETFQPAFVITQVAADAAALSTTAVDVRLLEVFRSHLPSGDWQMQTLEGRIEITLPARKAFSADSAVLQPGRISLVRRLGEVIGEAQNITGLTVAMSIGGIDNALARRRAAALARDLVRNGIMPTRFEAGTGRTSADTISIRLTPLHERDG
jgi:flagellar motor protein MotB